MAKREACLGRGALILSSWNYQKKGHKTITGNTNTRNSNTKALSNMCKLLGQWNVEENGPKNVWMAFLRGSARCQSRGHFRNMCRERVENPGKIISLCYGAPGRKITVGQVFPRLLWTSLINQQRWYGRGMTSSCYGVHRRRSTVRQVSFRLSRTSPIKQRRVGK